MRALAIVSCSALCCLGGCGDEGYGLPLPAPPLNWGPAGSPHFPAEEGGLVGVWFFCKKTGCAQLDDAGLLFKTDGTWRMVNAPGSSFEPGESFCEESEGGTFSWDGSRLEVVDSSGTKAQRVVFSVVLANEVATLYVGSQIQSILKRVSASSTGRCQELQPAPSP